METRSPVTVLSIATLALVVTFVGVPAVFAQQSASKIVLLSDTNVVPPGPEVPKDMAAFSGKWHGEWRGERTGTFMGEYVLVVEEITPPTASVIYAGISRRGGTWAYRSTAKFIEGALVFTSRAGATVTFNMNGDETLGGFYSISAGRNVSTLTRIE